MFMGAIPQEMRQIIHEYARSWPSGGDVYIGCSGNLTIERTLYEYGFQLHGNDINAYSCALGWFFAGQPVPFQLREESRELLDWMAPSLDDGAGTLAALMVGTRFLQWVGKDGTYYERMVGAHRDQWAIVHAKTKAKLEAAQLRLASFYAGDVREFLDRMSADDPVAMFPPFFSGDYESMFAGIDRHFDWPEPTYPELDEDGKDALVAQVVDRPRWILGLHIARDELRPFLRGRVQTTNRGVPIYVYASEGPIRVVAPDQRPEQIRMPKIGRDDELGDTMRLHVLTGGQFAQIRSQFMSKTIKPGQPLLAVGVSVDGRLVGAFAYLPPKFDPESAYLMSDFPVSWTRYRRLSKLIVMAAMSREAQLLLQRSLSRRVTSISTTAFSDRPNSSKYGRGIPGMRLSKRTSPASDEIHEFQLQYDGPLGAWTLAEALATWKTKHGGDLRREHQPEPVS